MSGIRNTAVLTKPTFISMFRTKDAIKKSRRLNLSRFKTRKSKPEPNHVYFDEDGNPVMTGEKSTIGTTEHSEQIHETSVNEIDEEFLTADEDLVSQEDDEAFFDSREHNTSLDKDQVRIS